MTPQKPSEGILLINDFVDAKSYRIVCDCGSNNHDVDMWIEVSKDNDIKSVDLTFYVVTRNKYWENWRQRLDMIFDILFKGQTKQEHTLILNQQSAINLANTIIEDVNILKGK